MQFRRESGGVLFKSVVMITPQLALSHLNITFVSGPLMLCSYFFYSHQECDGLRTSGNFWNDF